MNKVNAVLNQVSDFNKTELKHITEKLLQMLKEANGVAFVSSAPVDKCRRCNSEHIVKFGKDKNGKQRFKCKSCGATFTETSYSVISKTHCPIETWEKYIELLLGGASLERCAKECGISVRTAFIWRHKILNAMQKDQNNRCLAGIVEVDELFVNISYKGNHKKSKRFTMPRLPYKRGSDNKSATGSKACIMYAVERNGQTYGECIGKGQPTPKKIEYSLGERILPESVVVSDCAVGIQKYYAEHQTVDLIQMKCYRTVKKHRERFIPILHGIYHIQNVNNLHTRFRRFIEKYNGVSTKYLNHYVGLFIWIENYKKINNVNIKKEAIDYVCSTDTYISRDDLFALPAIPCVA